MGDAHPKALLQCLRAELDEHLEPYDLERPVAVCVADGLAFVL